TAGSARTKHPPNVRCPGRREESKDNPYRRAARYRTAIAASGERSGSDRRRPKRDRRSQDPAVAHDLSRLSATCDRVVSMRLVREARRSCRPKPSVEVPLPWVSSWVLTRALAGGDFIAWI